MVDPWLDALSQQKEKVLTLCTVSAHSLTLSSCSPAVGGLGEWRVSRCGVCVCVRVCVGVGVFVM